MLESQEPAKALEDIICLQEPKLEFIFSLCCV